ncbi:MAG: 3',5'-cyclic-nucleotide phosphodiesterase, partial [Candidatus Dadabacteria bacterium]|nr:3',5'-cyclic-nucleotide phosphodiesterase [Candidatus Dadabacteria bacterium]
MENNKPKFKVVVLGSAGGIEEDNLSSYLIAPVKSNNYAAIDAGTLLSGIKKAVQTGSLSDIDYPHDADLSLEGYILQNNIKAYVLTHAHLDHIAGLIINSPSDTNKNIYATRATIENLKNNVFNWEIWPNFGNEGVGFHIHKYSYITLKPGKETKLSEVALSLMPFSLSHGNGHYPSTAFLIKSNGSYVLFIGDTAPDSIENSENLKNIWAYTAPLIMKKKIRAIFIESSFANERPDHKLYGHL